MKRILFILVTFVLILNSFSMLGVAFMDHSVHQTCPFAVMSSKDCETVASAKGSLFHHIEAYQSMTSVVLSSGVSVLVLLLFAAVIVSIGKLLPHTQNPVKTAERIVLQARIALSIPDNMLRWIALHNKRNTHLNFWRVVT